MRGGQAAPTRPTAPTGPGRGAARRERRARRRRRTSLAVVVLVALGAAALAAVPASGPLHPSAAALLAGAQRAAGSLSASAAPARGAATSTGPSGATGAATVAAPSAATGPTTSAAPSTAAFDTGAHSTTDPTSPWVVVNKSHPVTPLDYAPASLTTVGGKQVSSQVVPDLTAMLAAATAQGVHLTLASAYRSYGYQVGVHDRLVRQRGTAEAESLSARPGYSEHQTGFAIDFGSSTTPACTLKDCFATTAEGRWLDAHAAEYGFLHRYTAADTATTGYASEAWHFRWIGRELAAQMAARRVTTLEAFFGVSGGTAYVVPSSP